MIKDLIKKAVSRQDLTREEAGLAMNAVMTGNATPSQISALLIALVMKGETIEEITGFAEKMREHAVHIHPKSEGLVDTCGTGGDLAHTFNISTIAAVVASGAGVRIAKHGNRSVSSKSGSADLLEALGVKIDLPPEKVAESIDQIGFGFMFAPNFHPAMKHAGPTRREIGMRTVFNILGPLTNPANAKLQILGVYSEKLTEVMARVLQNLGCKRALVVHGMDGLDEITISDRTKVSELKEDRIDNYFIEPEKFGLKKCSRNDLQVNSVEESKAVALEILEKHEKGPRVDIVVLNSAAAIYLAGLADNLGEAAKIAQQTIGSRAAYGKLEELRNVH